MTDSLSLTLCLQGAAKTHKMKHSDSQQGSFVSLPDLKFNTIITPKILTCLP